MEKHPDRSKIKIKPAFEERYKLIFGKEYDSFINCSLGWQRKSIRVNLIKTTPKDLKARMKEYKFRSVKWCPEGFWIEKTTEERFDLGNTIEHQLGLYYIQDASSMLPPEVVRKELHNIAKLGRGKVLDMCAAPGSKTSQMAALMLNKGILVANDVLGDRLKPLGMNLSRCGIRNVIVTKMYGHLYRKYPDTFDVVFCDVPCSGTGTIRKSLKTLIMWSPNMVRKLSRDQMKLLEAGFIAAKPGGTVVYSTCTQEPEENEAVVSWLLEKFPNAKLQDISLNVNCRDAITEWQGTKYHKDIKKCLRVAPQDNDSEGFFVAKIKKL